MNIQTRNHQEQLNILKDRFNAYCNYSLNVENPQTRLDWFVKTIYNLCGCQGAYSRLWSKLLSCEDNELQELCHDSLTFPYFKDTIDVIQFIEG